MTSKYKNKKCPIKSCNRNQRDIGYCGMHAQRIRRYGDPNFITSEKERRTRLRNAQPNLGKVQKHSYKKFHGRHEHRVIAEKMIGRKLKRNEIVHHRDGDRHNNKPSNLEIMSQSEHCRLHMKKEYKNT